MKLCRGKGVFYACTVLNTLHMQTVQRSPYRCDCTVYILYFFYMYVFLILHCKKGNYSWPGRVWVSDIPAGDGKMANLSLLRQNNDSYFSTSIFMYFFCTGLGGHARINIALQKITWCHKQEKNITNYKDSTV